MQGSARRSPAVRDLPGRTEAEKALAVALSGGRPSFTHVAAFFVREVPALLDRGEWREADAALLNSFLHLSRSMAAGDKVFRWSGATLVALLEREGGRDSVRQEVESLGGLLPRGVFALSGELSLEVLRTDIDLFVARHV